MADKVYVYRGPSGRFVFSGKQFERDGVARELTDEELDALSVSHPKHRFERAGADAAIDPDAVPSGSVADVLEWVGDDLERAQQALDAEQERDTPRRTLVEPLTEMLDGSPAGDNEQE